VSDSVTGRLNTALADRYRIEREIGSGGMATVYLAEDLKHRRKVAIKVLNPELAEALGADRFLREIEIAANLHHPHVLPLYDSGQDGGFLYYVMPYEEGQSLRERLVKEGELPIQETVKLLRDVADALAHAHEQGVVHRDIKPDNVLLSGRHALVTDFGVAKAVSEATGRHQLTTTGVALGTPAYMAPEQATGEEHIDHRADIYAFGALAYELLTGRPPFTGPTSQAILAAHVTEAPTPVTEGRASVPPALEALIMRCLEKKPADRWQSAEEMLPHLEAMATPSGGIQPTTAVMGQSAKARRALLWPAAAVVVILLVAAVVFWPRGSASTVIPSATKIAILPLAPTAEDEALTRLGRDLVVLLSGNLDGVGDINTVDPAVILVRSEDLGRPFTLEEGIDLARTFGAGSVLHGNLVRVGGDVRVDAQLVRTEDGGTVARLTTSVSGEDVGALADSTTWALLDEVWRGQEAPTPHLAAGMTTSFEALRAFLEGEEAHREGRYPAAWKAYERAFTADSTLWLAYWRYSSARTWMMLSVDPAISATWRAHIDEFPKLDREYLEANGTRPYSARLVALREFAERYPDYYPGWWMYGDRIVHSHILRQGTPLSEVIRAFERVVDLNPRMISAWEHLIFCYLVEGDLEKAEWALGELVRQGGQAAIIEGYGFDQVTLYRDFLGLRRGERALAQVADTLARMYGEAQLVNDAGVSFLASYSSVLGQALLQIEVNRRVAEDPGPYEPEDFLFGEALAWASRGAWDSALVALDRIVQSAGSTGTWATERYRHTVVGVVYGAVDPEVARQRRPAPGTDIPTPANQAWMAWHDGILGYAMEDPGAIAEARSRLAAMDTTATELFDRSLEVFELELQGNRDEARDRLVRLEEARADSALGFTVSTLFSVHRLKVAQWLREAGDPQRAAPLLRWHQGMLTGVSTLQAAVVASSLSYLEMGRVAEARGLDDEALKHYREFLRRYDMPPKQHLHLVEEARAAVERLGGQGESPGVAGSGGP